MKMHDKSSQLKAKARESLNGHYLTLSGAFFTVFILEYIVTIPNTLLDVKPPTGAIFYYVLLFLLRLFFAVFSVGMAFLYLSNACGQRINLNGLFSGFGQGPGKIMQLALLPTALEFVPDCLMNACVSRYIESFHVEWLYWALGAAACYLVLYAAIVIMYSQIYFVTLDFPDMTPLECLRYSRHLMKGHRCQYLYLLFSFIPMMLLGTITFGIGNLYVSPYMNQTLAYFYLDLAQNK